MEDFEAKVSGRMLFAPGQEGLFAAGELARRMNVPYVGKGEG